MYEHRPNRVPTIPAVFCDAARRLEEFHPTEIGLELQTTRGFFQPSIEAAAYVWP
jgi:hypothetical protein